MPSFDEIKKSLDFGLELFNKVCKILKIDEKEVEF